MNVAANSNRPRSQSKLDPMEKVARKEMKINRGVASGRLSESEATDLRGKLSELQKKIQTDGFEAAKGEWKSFKGELKGKMNDEQIDPNKRIDHIDRRIQKGIENGSLTEAEAGALKEKAAAMRKEVEAAKTPEEKAALAGKLKALSKEVYKEKHDGELDGTKKVQSFNDRIAAGLKDGSLTPGEANALKDKVTALGGGDDTSAVNALHKEIFNARHNGEMNSPAAVEALTKKIDDAQAAGKLTAEQAQQLREKVSAGNGLELNILRARISGLAA